MLGPYSITGAVVSIDTLGPGLSSISDLDTVLYIATGRNSSFDAVSFSIYI